MVGVDGPASLQIAVPNAGGHRAILTIVRQSGEKQVIELPAGHGTLSTITAALSAPVVRVPELVRAKELYGDSVRADVEHARTLISIPWSSVTGVSAEKVTNERWTFVRTDTG